MFQRFSGYSKRRGWKKRPKNSVRKNTIYLVHRASHHKTHFVNFLLLYFLHPIILSNDNQTPETFKTRCFQSSPRSAPYRTGPGFLCLSSRLPSNLLAFCFSSCSLWSRSFLNFSIKLISPSTRSNGLERDFEEP